MEKMKELGELKHSLIDIAKAEVAKGVKEIDAKELGEVVDMIKDLAEAEKACMEACVYSSMMEDDGGERMGYGRWRYASGRFAPKGRGRRGYTPEKMMPEPWPMGYDDGRDGRGRTDAAAYGRRGYDEGEPKERLERVMDAMGEVWADADDETKAKMKSGVKDLLYQMEQAV